jgi:hypothetical protein
MGRPRNAIRAASLHVMLPEDIKTRLDLYLANPSEKSVPQGAYKTFFTQLLTEFFVREDPGSSIKNSTLNRVYNGLCHIHTTASSPDVSPAEALARIARWSGEYRNLLKGE